MAVADLHTESSGAPPPNRTQFSNFCRKAPASGRSASMRVDAPRDEKFWILPCGPKDVFPLYIALVYIRPAISNTRRPFETSLKHLPSTSTLKSHRPHLKHLSSTSTNTSTTSTVSTTKKYAYVFSSHASVSVCV